MAGADGALVEVLEGVVGVVVVEVSERPDGGREVGRVGGVVEGVVVDGDVVGIQDADAVDGEAAAVEVEAFNEDVGAGVEHEEGVLPAGGTGEGEAAAALGIDALAVFGEELVGLGFDGHR